MTEGLSPAEDSEVTACRTSLEDLADLALLVHGQTLLLETYVANARYSGSPLDVDKIYEGMALLRRASDAMVQVFPPRKKDSP